LGLEGRIKAVDVWTILGLHGAQLTQEVYVRASEAMRKIGWVRPNTAGTARFDGKLMTAYVRGNGQEVIVVTRDGGDLYVGPERVKRIEKEDKVPHF
jgi:hypothetical protein